VVIDNTASLPRQVVLGRDFKVRKDVAPDLIRLINDATKAGHKINLTSGYR
jgi:LAS superfamily LD-carboxypeptidase LdcB